MLKEKGSESVIKCTHYHIFLEAFLATNQMRDLRRDIVRKCSSIDLCPMSHLFKRAPFSEVAGDGNDEAFEWLSVHDGRSGLVATFLVHG